MPLPVNHIKPMELSANCNMVLLNIDDKQLFWFDVENVSVKQVEIRRLPWLFDATICEWVGSLCLLDGT